MQGGIEIAKDRPLLLAKYWNRFQGHSAGYNLGIYHNEIQKLFMSQESKIKKLVGVATLLPSFLPSGTLFIIF